MVPLNTFAPLLLLLGILPALGKVIVKGEPGGVTFMVTDGNGGLKPVPELTFEINEGDRMVKDGVINVAEFVAVTSLSSDGVTKNTEKLHPKCKFEGSALVDHNEDIVFTFSPKVDYLKPCGPNFGIAIVCEDPQAHCPPA